MGLRMSTVLKALLFHAEIAVWLLALVMAVAGTPRWAAAAAVVGLAAHMAGRLWSRQSPVPMPYFMRWVLLVPGVRIPRLGCSEFYSLAGASGSWR